jgi:hypothetical protein
MFARIKAIFVIYVVPGLACFPAVSYQQDMEAVLYLVRHNLFKDFMCAGA